MFTQGRKYSSCIRRSGILLSSVPAIAILVLLSVLLAPPHASSQQPATITELQERIARLEREIEEAETRARQLAEDETQQSAYLKELGSQIANTEQLINAYNRDITRLSNETTQLRSEITSLNEDISRLQGAVESYVVGLYKRGLSKGLEIIVGSQTFTDAVRRLKGVTIVATRHRRNVDQLTEVRDQRMQNRTEITTTLNSLEESRTSQSRARQNLNTRKAEAEQLLGRIAQDRELVFALIQESENSLAELIRELQRVQRRLRDSGRSIEVELGGFAEMRGRLPWPLFSPRGVGEVVRIFGRLRGRDNTTTTSPGIDIMAPGPNTEIIAVHNAIVLHVGWLAYMGTVVVLDHGDLYMTVYTNVENHRVQLNDPVEMGFPLGEVGLSLRPVGDEPDGHLLRFSIYEDGNAQDPLPWLGANR